MDYREFKGLIQEEIKNILSNDTELRNYEVVVSQHDMGIAESMDVCCLVEKGKVSVAPVFPLYSYYDNYADVKEAAADFVLNYKQVLSTLDKERAFVSGLNDTVPIDFNTLFCEVVSSKAASEAQIPHKDMHGISIIYRTLISKETDGTLRSMVITNSIMEKMGINQELLHQYASFNTKKVLPATIKDMDQAVLDFYSVGDNVCLESGEFGEGLSKDSDLYELSNVYKQFGSYYMLDNGVMNGLAEFFNDDIIVLPASIHDVQIAPYERVIDEELDIEALKSICVFECKKISSKERLSDKPYVWSKDRKRLEVLDHDFVRCQKKNNIKQKKR